MDKRRIIFVAFVTICLFVSQGCRPRCKEGASLPSEEGAGRYPGLSDKLEVDVYLDATRSMEGFIDAGVSSYYVQALQLLERAAGKGWDKVGVKHYKFGDRIDEIKGRAYLEASRPGFYNDPRYSKRTFIENVIDRANPENLTIIVTDLFQNDSDVTLLTRKLKDKYLAQSYAVGILGIKSQFDGVVYDVGIKNYSFPYASGVTEQARFRPFYALLLGKHADIEHYYGNLRTSGLDEFPVKEFSIFSRYLGHPVASFEQGKITSISKIAEVNGLLAPGIKDDRVKQFLIRDNTAKGSFTAVLKYRPLPYAIQYDVNAFEAEVTAWKCQPTQLEENPAVRQALNVRESRLSGEELSVEVEIIPVNLPGVGIYRFKVVLRPKSYQIPGWVTDWDMRADLIEKWKQNPNSFNGATTLNLKPFLSDLQGTIIQMHRPEVSELYCYVQKK